MYLMFHSSRPKRPLWDAALLLLVVTGLVGGPVGAAFRPIPTTIQLKRSPAASRRTVTKIQTFGFTVNSLTIRGGSVMAPAMVANLATKSGIIVSWAVALGGFLIRNYKTAEPWPGILATGSRRGWNFTHAVSSTIFSGTILVTTLLEWLVVRSASPAVLKFWFSTIPAVDVAVVLPALTGAVVSGVAQSVQEYGKVAEAPKYVKAVLHSMATFGLWWAATDRPTQYKARQAVMTWLETNGPVPSILQWRRASNLVSCAFVMVLYILMVLKPGRPDLPPIR